MRCFNYLMLLCRLDGLLMLCISMCLVSHGVLAEEELHYWKGIQTGAWNQSVSEAGYMNGVFN